MLYLTRRTENLLRTEKKMKRLMVILVALVLGTGCADMMHKHRHAAQVKTPVMKDWKPGKRCHVLARVKTANVAVMIERNCLKNGVTTVNMLVLNPEDKGRVAAEDAVRIVTSVLKFKPTLAALFYGKTQGKVFILAAVTEVSSMGGIAARE